MKGELAQGVVPDLLRELYVGRRTGTLSLVKEDEEQSLRVRGGHIVNAHTTVKEDRLGETLVRRGLLTEDDFARATEVALQSNKRLGQAFLELGILDESGLEDAVALHIHTLLAKVFTWDEGTFSFEQEEEVPGELTLKLSTADLILEAVRAISDPDVVRYLLGDMDRVLALSNDPLLRFQQLRLSPNDGFVLSRVDGTLSAREIEGMIPLPPEEVRQSLLGLLSTGIVEYLEGERRPREVEPSAGTPPAAPPPEAPSPPPEVPGPPEPSAEPPAPPPPEAANAPEAPPADEAPPVSEAPSPPSEPPPPPPPEPPPEPAPAAAPPSPPPAPEPEPEPPAPSTPPPVAEPAPAEGPGDERRLEIEEAWEGRKSRTHFEVLGLERSATATEVKEAYFQLAKRFHPDAHHSENLGDLRDKLEAVFIRLGEAYEVLRDAEKRGEYEAWIGRPKPKAAPAPDAAVTEPAAPDAPPAEAPDPEEEARRAEAAVGEALALYKKEKYWDAIQKVEPILETLTDRLRLRAQLILARCYLQNPKWVKTAKETLETAVRESPRALEAYALLGALYKQQGLRSRAASMYRRVLELQPDHAEAAEALAELGPKEKPPPPDEGGGFLKKIFRR
jgi:tetratricopeptide (TPR) repeat protein